MAHELKIGRNEGALSPGERSLIAGSTADQKISNAINSFKVAGRNDLTIVSKLALKCESIVEFTSDLKKSKKISLKSDLYLAQAELYSRTGYHLESIYLAERALPFFLKLNDVAKADKAVMLLAREYLRCGNGEVSNQILVEYFGLDKIASEIALAGLHAKTMRLLGQEENWLLFMSLVSFANMPDNEP